MAADRSPILEESDGPAPRTRTVICWSDRSYPMDQQIQPPHNSVEKAKRQMRNSAKVSGANISSTVKRRGDRPCS
jgi:hypothetical protein